MPDRTRRTCRHCGVEIFSDILRGWVSGHHEQRTPYGTSVTFHWVMWQKCAAGKPQRHEPVELPPREPDALEAWLDA